MLHQLVKLFPTLRTVLPYLNEARMSRCSPYLGIISDCSRKKGNSILLTNALFDALLAELLQSVLSVEGC